MKTPYYKVADALDDYYKGKSIADICDSLHTPESPRPSTKTVYGWITKFTNEAIGQFKDYQPQVGNALVADETVIKLDGKNIWCIDIIDRDTRYLIATKLSPNREMKDIKALMEDVREKTGKVPKRVLTDGWVGYPDAIERAYGADAKHIATDPFTKQDNTEIIERWHGTLKERTKVLRGLKSIETADKFLGGFLVWYNYLRPHESLNGRTPGEVAKVDYSCKTWADVVRFSKPHIQVLTTPAKVDILSERKTLVRPITRRTYDVDKKRARRRVNRLEKSLSRKAPRISKKRPHITRPVPSITSNFGGLPK
ncbi:MAG: DDE-type integrase/transposase/recombinase [Chloroflexi bacterium]|nr:DDE-type integrase/transposase/recombinase [Chloroflexota bacterium]